MTICISVITQAGIVLAGDGRSINIKDPQNVNLRDTSQPLDFSIITDNQPKIHLVADRFAVAYSGFGYLQNWNWNLQQSINELDRLIRFNMRHNKAFDPRCGGEMLDELMNKAVPGINFERDFVWVGHDLKGRAFQVVRRDGRDITDEIDAPCGYREAVPGYPNGYFHSGEVVFGRIGVINKLLAGEQIPWDKMSLRDIVECVEWLLAVGTGGLRFFEGEQATSGGRVDILVLSPMWHWGKWVKNKTLHLFGEGCDDIEA